MQVRHIGIYVNNLERMKAFYCKNFNMEIFLHTTEKGTYIDTLLGVNKAILEIYKLSAPDGGMIELLKYNGSYTEAKDEEMVWATGKMHIALTVNHIEQKYQEMLQLGIPFLSAPCTAPDGKAKVCFCRDPEGNYLELVEEVRT